MDPLDSAQEIVVCALCQTPENPVYCDVCHKYLCKDCTENYFSDSCKVHPEAPLKQTYTIQDYPKCRNHETKRCELYCEQCDTPMCVQCTSEEHSEHEQVDIYTVFESKRDILKRELKELEKSIYPKYQEIASNIKVQKTDLSKNSQKLTTDINKRGKLWHREIDTIIAHLTLDIEVDEIKYQDILNKKLDEITLTISEITHNIDEMKKLLNFQDVLRVFEYKSRNAEFKRMPHKLIMSLPKFTPIKINRDRMSEQFGSLSALSLTSEVLQEYYMPTLGPDSSSQVRSLMDVPRVITKIDTSYDCGLCGVTCRNDAEIWTCGNNRIMELYNLQGELLKSVQTKSGNRPQDIALTTKGDLVYTDYSDRTVNIVKNTQIQTVIRLQGWRPLGVCSTSSGDLLVVMDSDDYKQTKVVRYSGSTEKQSIQYDDKEQPLYSFGGNKYVSENRNQDICVSESDARALVVVNEDGKLRFTYTGPPSTSNGSFDPYGITTDSQGRILTADCINQCIHILDQNGQFLRYIDNRDLLGPFDVCVDTRDNLFAAEWSTGKVKTIQYYM